MCFDRCLKGRAGKCCYGCSTGVGIHLIALLSLGEVALVTYLFFHELGEGIFNMKVMTWLAITLFRVGAYFPTCFADSISKRKCFMWVMVITTLVEICMFTIMNVNLFDGEDTEKVFRLAVTWGLSEGFTVALTEVVTLAHLILFCYFSAIAYESYTMAADDPKMIEAEHNKLAEIEKAAAAERKR